MECHQFRFQPATHAVLSNLPFLCGRDIFIYFTHVVGFACTHPWVWMLFLWIVIIKTFLLMFHLLLHVFLFLLSWVYSIYSLLVQIQIGKTGFVYLISTLTYFCMINFLDALVVLTKQCLSLDREDKSRVMYHWHAESLSLTLFIEGCLKCPCASAREGHASPYLHE